MTNQEWIDAWELWAANEKWHSEMQEACHSIQMSWIRIQHAIATAKRL